MSKTLKLVIIAVICISAFVGVYFLYNSLSDKYIAENTTETTVGQVESLTDEIINQALDSNQNGKAPDFVLTDENGNEIKLSDFEGKPIVLNFWTSWCGYCVMEMPYFNKAYHDYPQVQFLMVNVACDPGETMEKAQALISENGYDFPVVYDMTGETSDSYMVYSYPTTVIIDSDGNAYHYLGAMTEESLKAAIERVL